MRFSFGYYPMEHACSIGVQLLIFNGSPANEQAVTEGLFMHDHIWFLWFASLHALALWGKNSNH